MLKSRRVPSSAAAPKPRSPPKPVPTTNTPTWERRRPGGSTLSWLLPWTALAAFVYGYRQLTATTTTTTTSLTYYLTSSWQTTASSFAAVSASSSSTITTTTSATAAAAAAAVNATTTSTTASTTTTTTSTTTTNTDNTPAPTTNLTHLEQALRNSSIPFYMYELDELLSPTVHAKVQDIIHYVVGNQTCPFSNSYCADLEAEQFILRALAQHPHRCYFSNPPTREEEAVQHNYNETARPLCPPTNDQPLIHILPLPVMALFAVDCNTLPDLKKCGQATYMKRHNEVHTALRNWRAHPRAQHGLRHVMLSLRSRFFKGREARPYQKYLYNVTLANNFDPIACQDMVQKGVAGEYTEKYKESEPLTKSNMVLGIGITGALPFPAADDYAAWQGRRNFLFYRIRTTRFSNGAHAYRHAPLDHVNWTALPHSCIGYDMPADQWLGNLTDSKYCLVMRGDTPHTHALLRAVRVGCIPIVVSDQYQRYAGPFKSLFKIADFSVQIPEATFRADPHAALASLVDLSPATIQATLHGMALARRLLFPDHPESLFVPSFLQDAENSMKHFQAYYD